MLAPVEVGGEAGHLVRRVGDVLQEAPVGAAEAEELGAELVGCEAVPCSRQWKSGG